MASVGRRQATHELLSLYCYIFHTKDGAYAPELGGIKEDNVHGSGNIARGDFPAAIF
jgi:hypothetical protein